MGEDSRLSTDDLAALNKFKKVMLRKLSANADKSHWSGWENSYFLERLDDELAELKTALINCDEESSVIEECADVANFAMMIADNARVRLAAREARDEKAERENESLTRALEAGDRLQLRSWHLAMLYRDRENPRSSMVRDVLKACIKYREQRDALAAKGGG